jgi:hypothetical protein
MEIVVNSVEINYESTGKYNKWNLKNIMEFTLISHCWPN